MSMAFTIFVHYSSVDVSAYDLRSFSCTSDGTSSYDENFIVNEERPPVMELSAVEYDDISFNGTRA